MRIHSSTVVVGEVESLSLRTPILCVFDVVEWLHDFTFQYHAQDVFLLMAWMRSLRNPGSFGFHGPNRAGGGEGGLMRTTCFQFPSFRKGASRAMNERTKVTLNDRPLDSRFYIKTKHLLPVNSSSTQFYTSYLHSIDFRLYINGKQFN